MASSDQLPPKKDVGRALLLRGSVFVHLDPRLEGVDVPPHLKSQPQLVLQIGLDLPIPIPDLRVDDSGVFGTLSFNRTPYTCTVPWDAVFALVGEDGRGLVWPESMPTEIAAEVEREAGRRSPAPPTDGGASERPGEVAADVTGKVIELDARRPRSPGTALAPVPRDEPADPAAESPVTDEEGSDPEQTHAARPSDRRRRGRKGRELPPYLKVVK